MHHAYAGAFVLVVISWVLGVRGLWRLLRTRNFVVAILIVTAIIACPLGWVALMQIGDDHLRMWVAFLYVPLLSVWLMFGYFVDSIGRTEVGGVREEPALGASRHRMLGAIAIVTGASCWGYGATHPDMTKGVELVVLATALYGLLLGLYWTATGRRLFA